jgi:hypothetical protein
MRGVQLSEEISRDRRLEHARKLWCRPPERRMGESGGSDHCLIVGPCSDVLCSKSEKGTIGEVPPYHVATSRHRFLPPKRAGKFSLYPASVRQQTTSVCILSVAQEHGTARSWLCFTCHSDIMSAGNPRYLSLGPLPYFDFNTRQYRRFCSRNSLNTHFSCANPHYAGVWILRGCVACPLVALLAQALSTRVALQRVYRFRK